MNNVIKIGTRDSELALWQAKTVQEKLENLGYKTQLVPVKSQGDLQLDQPLYELGITGIFTKTLDIAMLNGTVDIAVHSMKDVPTALPIGIQQTAVLERANTADILVYKELAKQNTKGIVATGSLRRKAQWLHRYPHDSVVDLRGNVNTRLQKLNQSNWNGAIFAQAGLARINVLPEHHIVLDWMIAAPAQGAMVVVTKTNDAYCTQAVAQLNHKPSEICTTVERQFLRTLEGGCTAPIGAEATLNNKKVTLKGCLLSLDGKEYLSVEKTADVAEYLTLGDWCAKELLQNGGAELMKKIKQEMND